MIIKPRKLIEGSTIALVAPSSPPDSSKLNRGKAFLLQSGYKVKIYPQTRRRMGYLAGDDRGRAEAINEAFADNDIDAVFCARGGYGALRILPYLEFDVIKKNPKIFAGYSDITVLLLSIYKMCKFVTFHGPMAAVEFSRDPKQFTKDRFFSAVRGDAFTGDHRKPRGYRNITINTGTVEGRIIGGNLCLMTKLIGTGFLPLFRNKIVFFEDTEEEPYRTDGYLSQLFQSTDFGEAKGYVIGEFTRTESRYGSMKGWNVRQVINDYFKKAGKPGVFGYPCGHGREKITIPIGVRARFDAGKGSLIFKESGVR